VQSKKSLSCARTNNLSISSLVAKAQRKYSLAGREEGVEMRYLENDLA
jgi:hypothetical protein